jgi:hypothetical protein
MSIADGMFPKSFLPYTATTMATLPQANFRFHPAGSEIPPRETFLEDGNSCGIIGIILRQPPDHVKMIRQKNHTFRVPRPFLAGLPNDPSQCRRNKTIRENVLPILSNDREEEHTTLIISTIPRHEKSVSNDYCACNKLHALLSRRLAEGRELYVKKTPWKLGENRAENPGEISDGNCTLTAVLGIIYNS